MTTNAESGLPRPSAIPRLSRLPVPRAGGLRPAPSRENLQPPQPSRTASATPHLRAPQGLTQRDTIKSVPRTTSNASHYDPKPAPRLRKAASSALLRKPSRTFLNEAVSRPDPVIPDSSEEDGTQEEYGSEESNSANLPRRHRPSLSERTMETLLAASPAVRRRESNFFNPESPMQTSSRPSSKDSSMGPPFRSFSSRPSSSANSEKHVPTDFRASTNTFRSSQSSFQSNPTILQRPSTAKSQTPSSIRSMRSFKQLNSASKIAPLDFGKSTGERSPSPAKANSLSSSGSRTLPRSLKPRGSVQGLFHKSSLTTLEQSPDVTKTNQPKKLGTTKSTLSKSPKKATSTPVTPPKASISLRDQIAKAKAAKRDAESKKLSSISPSNVDDIPVVPVDSFDFGLNDNPFNQQIDPHESKGLLRKRIAAARIDGRLNIAAMGLKEIPGEVMSMYDSSGAQDGSWAETVDLTRFVAADNELERLADDVFPDLDAREAMEDEDAKGNQFGGLEALDLHGNVLVSLPLGLRRLELLTSLNLSNNKLANDCFSVISQIPSLRDLKIAGNGLTGSLDESITNLRNLEILDMQRNTLTSLPDALADLVRLRVLNITENKFSSLPFEILRQLPLIELLAAKNVLGGILVADEVDELPLLQVLDVTGNALKGITASKLELPVLHQLRCSSNRLEGLPDVTSWVSLLTLTAEDNNISVLPDGFVTLPKVKNVDFSGNNLKALDDRIGGMDSLDVFRIRGNPFRERKFSSLSTAELKRALKSRMEPTEVETILEIPKETEDNGLYSAQASPSSLKFAEWPIKAGGVLDRSNTQSHSLNPVVVAHIASTNAIKEVLLNHNKFREIPVSIAFFAGTLTTLSLTHNELTSDTFLVDDLELPALKDLNLSSNTFNSLAPLLSRLVAPNLEKLDVSFNRLINLPPLTPHFPKLTTLLASNNTIRELSPETVKGLRVLDCSSNEISSLNARIGLLGGAGGLERLEVKGNRFRVPKYTILEKGTEATLAWLRDRIPARSEGKSPSPSFADVD